MSASRGRELKHFLLLGPDQQRQAIQRLASSRMRDDTIAAARGLSVEQIRSIIGAGNPRGRP